MRFLVLVLGATGLGAASVVSLQMVFPEHKASMMAAVRSAGAGVSQFRLSDLNPVRRAYDHVASEITSPNRKLDFPESNPVVVGGPLKFTPMDFGGGMKAGALPGHMGSYPGRH